MRNTLIILLLLIAGRLQGQTVTQAVFAKLDAQINQYVDSISPGIAVGIVQDKTVIYEKYLGLSNLEHHIPIDQHSRFNIASNAKQFTALCVLRLLNEGKIDLEDDIRTYMPDFYKHQNQKITITNLLTHTSGIRDVYDLWALKGKTWWQLFIDNGDALDLIKAQKDLNFAPGSDYLYSNSNYILLTEIIKNISGKDFAVYALELFKEMEMEQTSFLTNYMSVIPNKARPYGTWNSWIEYPSITETHGDGALFTTLSDQLKWEIILQQNNGAPLSQKIINQSQQAITSTGITEYGYGLMFGTYKGMDYGYHDGSTGAYNATFLRFPSQNTSLVLLSNNGNVPTNYLAKQLADIYFNIENSGVSEFPAGPDKIEPLGPLSEIVGNYKSDGGTIIKILENNGDLYREIYQRDPVKLINEKGNLFYYETNEDLKIAFSKTDSGESKFTIYFPSQEPNVGIRLPSKELEPNYYPSLSGTYFNDETDTEIVINHIKDNGYSIIKNGRARNGELVLPDLLRMNSYEIRISRDNDNTIDGLLVNNGRIQNVRFIKK